jgi:hypothetical protein
VRAVGVSDCNGGMGDEVDEWLERTFFVFPPLGWIVWHLSTVRIRARGLRREIIPADQGRPGRSGTR